MDNKATGKIKSVENTVKILDLILSANQPLGVNEISRQSSISLATSFRILKTLSSSGWVYQDKEDRYLIGPKISFVTEKNNFYIVLKEISYYIMSRLTEKTSQAMNLVVRDNNKCYIIQQTRTNKIVDYVPPIGTLLPVYASACGKVLLSELPEPLLDDILDSIDLLPLTKYTITERAQLLESLIKCRHNGYALDAKESMEHAYCIAVPIRFGNGEIIAALSCSGILSDTISNDIILFYVKLLSEGAAEISKQLYALNTKIIPNQNMT